MPPVGRHPGTAGQALLLDGSPVDASDLGHETDEFPLRLQGYGSVSRAYQRLKRIHHGSILTGDRNRLELIDYGGAPHFGRHGGRGSHFRLDLLPGHLGDHEKGNHDQHRNAHQHSHPHSERAQPRFFGSTGSTGISGLRGGNGVGTQRSAQFAPVSIRRDPGAAIHTNQVTHGIGPSRFPG
ncbi:MAG: hypothetical protein F4Y00_11020 [Bacteroidetes bacterium SB0662_bin_6]|nr:hypothetical protein [Bacteroidetes bacterium SB0668_bin_1]MYE05488.1 hypothetical protein [Bacteroidetes bacterium SB0662_bin_6]